VKIRNISPRGGLDVPLLRRTIDAGEVVDVTAAQARALLPQHDNFAPADKPARDLAAELLAPAADTEGSPA